MCGHSPQRSVREACGRRRVGVARVRMGSGSSKRRPNGSGMATRRGRAAAAIAACLPSQACAHRLGGHTRTEPTVARRAKCRSRLILGSIGRPKEGASRRRMPERHPRAQERGGARRQPVFWRMLWGARGTFPPQSPPLIAASPRQHDWLYPAPLPPPFPAAPRLIRHGSPYPSQQRRKPCASGWLARRYGPGWLSSTGMVPWMLGCTCSYGACRTAGVKALFSQTINAWTGTKVAKIKSIGAPNLYIFPLRMSIGDQRRHNYEMGKLFKAISEQNADE